MENIIDIHIIFQAPLLALAIELHRLIVPAFLIALFKKLPDLVKTFVVRADSPGRVL